MKSPDIPFNEEKRLQALRDLDVLDTDPEERFDRIVKILSHILEVPIALVSLIDRDRQWFKAVVGLNAKETSREISFCGHAILQEELFEVTNALEDDRFYDNPLVENDPSIRFYAGYPLKTPEGHKVGTLCAIGQKPKELTDKEREIFHELAQLVERELTLKRVIDLQKNLIGEVEKQKALTRELEKNKEKAEEVSRTKSLFLANMSHELRTPLNAIIGYSEMLIEDFEGRDEDSVSDLKRIKSAGTHLLSLIGNILDLSKIEAGKIELDIDTFSLENLIENICELVPPLAEKRENDFIVHKSENIGHMTSDATKVRQILYNLLSNAFKFTEEGEVELKINSTVKDDKEWIHFTISDTGIGISPEEKKHLFQDFTQADASTTRKYGGTGLGLALCKKFASLLKGTIDLESSPGQGSTFTVQLPRDWPQEALDPGQDQPRS